MSMAASATSMRQGSASCLMFQDTMRIPARISASDVTVQKPLERLLEIRSSLLRRERGFLWWLLEGVVAGLHPRPLDEAPEAVCRHLPDGTLETTEADKREACQARTRQSVPSRR